MEFELFWQFKQIRNNISFVKINVMRGLLYWITSGCRGGHRVIVGIPPKKTATTVSTSLKMSNPNILWSIICWNSQCSFFFIVCRYWAEDVSSGDCGFLSSESPTEKNWNRASCQFFTYFICQVQIWQHHAFDRKISKCSVHKHRLLNNIIISISTSHLHQ